jgi:quercetin dioxygenase-like cupin family protein
VHKPNYFKKDAPIEEIVNYIKSQGFIPIRISNSPGYEYIVHTHPETKILVGLKGYMKVQVETVYYTLKPGDLLIIEGNKVHNAKVGDEGCVFYWAEKLKT